MVEPLVTPLSDDAVPVQFRVHVPAWRKLAIGLGYTGPVVWRIREGFTLKGRQLLTGHRYEHESEVQSWLIQNDESTIASIVFWIPRLLPNSFWWKGVKEQLVLLDTLRAHFKLPDHHLRGFGSSVLLYVLVSAHARLTHERVPLDRYSARTDTFHVDGHRQYLCWEDYWQLIFGLCDETPWLENMGVFPVGMEPFGDADA